MTRRAQVPERIQKTVLKKTCKCPLTMLWDLQALISNNIHDINFMTIIYNYFRLYCTAQANAHINAGGTYSQLLISQHRSNLWNIKNKSSKLTINHINLPLLLFKDWHGGLLIDSMLTIFSCPKHPHITIMAGFSSLLPVSGFTASSFIRHPASKLR